MQMGINRFICGAIVAAMMPTVALADNPRDPTMRSAAARARDREQTRQLNLAESASVRERDARNARRWRAERIGSRDADEYAVRSQEHERAMANYNRSRMLHEREMAEWRRAVNACLAGDYSACDN